MLVSWLSLLRLLHCLLLILHSIRMTTSYLDNASIDLLSDSESTIIEPPSIFPQIHPINWPGGQLVVVPNDDDYSSWMQWWKNTQYNRKHEIKIDWQLKRMTADIWEFLVPVAEVTTGKPWILCRRCIQAIAHPSLKNAGTSSLKKHLSSRMCQKHERIKLKQQSKQSSGLLNRDLNDNTIPIMFSTQSTRKQQQDVSKIINPALFTNKDSEPTM